MVHQLHLMSEVLIIWKYICFIWFSSSPSHSQVQERKVTSAEQRFSVLISLLHSFNEGSRCAYAARVCAISDRDICFTFANVVWSPAHCSTSFGIVVCTLHWRTQDRSSSRERKIMDERGNYLISGIIRILNQFYFEKSLERMHIPILMRWERNKKKTRGKNLK